MAHIKTWSITFYTLVLALFYAPFLQASPHTATLRSAAGHSPSLATKEKHRSSLARRAKPYPHTKCHPLVLSHRHTTTMHREHRSLHRRPLYRRIVCRSRPGYKRHCFSVPASRQTVLTPQHKLRINRARKTAMNKLMRQLGKPYHWGGSSPMTGFDCSGLVYYAYKDLVNIPIPRTADGMFHLRDAAPVDRSALERGDLVFFRIRGREGADHVGVYLGNGKFIQSPRTGKDIQITSLSKDYWREHYIGARRMMTSQTVR